MRFSLLPAFLAIILAALPISLARDAEARRYAAIVVDHESGEVLHARKADTLVYPASLTKMMTLYMLFEALDRGKLKLSSKLPVSSRAAGMPASRLGLKRGSSITVEDAIKALATKSANDVAVVVAEALGKTESRFAVRMTERARALGMSKTTFKNASGLPNRHQKTTARDMATLSRKLIADHPDRYHYFGLPKFEYRGRTYRSHHKLMSRYRGMDGLKTGYIRASGYNLAASAKRSGRRLITIVFGGKTSGSRDAEVARLMDLGFSRIEERRRNHIVLGPPVPKPDSIAVQSIASLAHDRPGAIVSTQRSGPQPSEDSLPVVHAARPGAIMPSPKPGMRLDAGEPKLAARGSYGVQVGAFHDPDKARRAAYQVAQKLPDLLLRGNVDVSALRSGRKPVYRARLVGFSRSEAQTACKLLRRERVECLVLQVSTLHLAQHG